MQSYFIACNTNVTTGRIFCVSDGESTDGMPQIDYVLLNDTQKWSFGGTDYLLYPNVYPDTSQYRSYLGLNDSKYLDKGIDTDRTSLYLGQLFVQKYKLNFDYQLTKNEDGKDTWNMTLNIETSPTAISTLFVYRTLANNPGSFIFAALVIWAIFKLSNSKRQRIQ